MAKRDIVCAVVYVVLVASAVVSAALQGLFYPV